MPEEKVDKSDLIYIHLRRGEDLIMSIRVHPDLEEFFKQQADDKKSKSSKWSNGDGHHKFYSNSYKDRDDEVAAFLKSHYDDYGQGYIKTKKGMGEYAVRPNVALFRTVGLSEGKEFKLDNAYSQETLKEAQRSLQAFAYQLYKRFIRPVTIESTIKFKEQI